METLIDKLFDKSQADAIRKLWKDKNSRLLIEQEIGKELISKEKIIIDLPLTQLMFVTSLSPFANSEDECFKIAHIIYWGLKRNDILPMVSESIGSQEKIKELAYKCLVSLGFFKKALIRRCERYGAPSPKFYRGIGISSFGQIGMEAISAHFYQWENFISEVFI